MNFSTLKTELSARGFDYLSDTRLGQYVNWARAELDDVELWPYRRTSASGAAPLTIATLGPIETVFDPATLVRLPFADYRDLIDPITTGTAIFYYLSAPTVVSLNPVSTTSITVTYYAITPDLTGTDTPASPTRFHRLIVDMAAARAYRDADNFEMAVALQAEIERDLTVMRNALLLPNVDGPQSYIQITDGWG